MSALKQGLPYVIIGALLFFIITQRCERPQSTRTTSVDTTAHVTTDSTAVDYDWLFTQPDTVYQTVKDPVPVKVDSSVTPARRTYRRLYSDSLITASWQAQVSGSLERYDFQYVPKPIQQKTVTRWRTNTITVTKEVRITQPPGFTLTGGLTVGAWPDRFMIAPTIGGITPNRDSFYIGYDPINKGVLVGGQIKLSFKPLL